MRLLLALAQRLRCEHAFAFAGADAEGDARRRRRACEVWLSPQTSVTPGRVKPSSGPMTCTMPWRSSRIGM